MEGPSLLIIKDELSVFKGKKVTALEGNTTALINEFKDQTLKEIKTWGKHLILKFKTKASIRIHFLMFGSYRINERKDQQERLRLIFNNGEVNFYNCSVKVLHEKLEDIYDWSTDVLSPQWCTEKAFDQVKLNAQEEVADILLDQEIFSGVGNIIKNEVLFNVKLHPKTKVASLSNKEVKNLIKETEIYCHNFLRWKKVYELKKHWQVFRKRTCPICETKISKEKTGKRNRISHYCEKCQILKTKPVRKPGKSKVAYAGKTLL